MIGSVPWKKHHSKKPPHQIWSQRKIGAPLAPPPCETQIGVTSWDWCAYKSTTAETPATSDTLFTRYYRPPQRDQDKLNPTHPHCSGTITIITQSWSPVNGSDGFSPAGRKKYDPAFRVPTVLSSVEGDWLLNPDWDYYYYFNCDHEGVDGAGVCRPRSGCLCSV